MYLANYLCIPWQNIFWYCSCIVSLLCIFPFSLQPPIQNYPSVSETFPTARSIIETLNVDVTDEMCSYYKITWLKIHKIMQYFFSLSVFFFFLEYSYICFNLQFQHSFVPRKNQMYGLKFPKRWICVNCVDQNSFNFSRGFWSFRGGCRTAATSKMEHFLIIVNGQKPSTVITKCSILDVAAVLDPPLSKTCSNNKIWKK